MEEPLLPHSSSQRGQERTRLRGCRKAFRHARAWWLAVSVIAGWVACWLGFAQDGYREWVSSCGAPVSAGNHLVCQLSSSSWQLLALPAISAFGLAVMAPVVAKLIIITLPGSAAKLSGWWATKGGVAATLTVAVIGLGSALMAVWLPPQHWHRELDFESIGVSVSGLCLTLIVGLVGSTSKSFSISLVSMFGKFWQIGLLLVLQFGDDFDRYPCPSLLGAGLVWWVLSVHALHGLIILLAQLRPTPEYGNGRTYGKLTIASNVALLFATGISLMWEAGYSENFVRLVPLVLMLLSLALFLEDVATSTGLVAEVRGQVCENDDMDAAQHDELGPQDIAGLLSTYTFWWVFPTLKSANQLGRLDQEHLPRLPIGDRPDTLYERFCTLWRHRFEQREKKGPVTGGQLIYMLCYLAQQRVFLSSLLHGWLFLLLMLADPLLLKVLLSYEGHNRIAVSLGLIAILSVSMFFRVTCMEVCYFNSCRVNNNARTILATAILRKTLRGSASNRYNAGTLTNLMATDADKLGKTSWMTFFLAQWTWAVGSLPIVIYCMHNLVGNAIWIGLGTIILGGFASRKLGMMETPAVRRLQKRRDERSQLMKEVLASISDIKLQAWEDEWRDRIYAARAAEMKELVVMRMLQAANILIGALLWVCIPVSVFAWYTAVDGNQLDSATAFSLLAWITQMQWSMSVLPQIYNMFASLSPTMDRLAAFLDSDTGVAWLEEEMGDDARMGPPEHSDGEQATLPENVAIRLSGPASFGYETDAVMGGESGPTSVKGNVVVQLSNLDLSVNKGEFVVIAGPVGSGKSTLLSGLAHGLDPLEGQCVVRGKRAFVSQHPFLLNDSLKNNILFGRELNHVLYARCLAAAALQQDLKALERGDETLIGENGVQLSGGQKSRVAFARALYSEADCYFFDDILSAVDATTGQFIWNNTLSGMLQGKTILLVTHQLQYLSRPQVTKVVLIGPVEDLASPSGIIAQGPWPEVRTSMTGDISAYVGSGSPGSGADVPESLPGGNAVGSASTSDSESSLAVYHSEEEQDARRRRKHVQVSIRECEVRLRALLVNHDGCTLDLPLIDEICATLRGDQASNTERKRKGFITWIDLKVYLDVFGSNCTLALLLVSLLLKAVLDVGMNLWLSIWGDSGSSNLGYLYIYVAIGVISAFFASIQYILLTVCALAASRKIHHKMFESLVGATMSFFDQTPSGQIMNRFLQDLANIDNYVPNTITDQVTKTLNMLTQVGLVLAFAPWVLLSLPFIIVPYFLIFGTVRCAARDSRRLEAMAHSPVYTQFSDMLRGRLCIKAYAAEKRFENWNTKLVTAMSQGKYANEAVSKWAQTLTTQNGCILYLVCGLLCVLLVYNGSMTSGQFGLVLLYASNLQRASMDYMMGLTNLESQFVSVERIAEFTRTTSEVQLARERAKSIDSVMSSTIETGWPHQGDITFKDVKLRYALHRELVLNGLSFQIKGGSKVALCGRTGCGKSTTFSALGGLYPIASGKIEIDGVDIHAIPLNKVRRALRVITQDSVLVCGTLRSNLASANNFATEEDMWFALEQVEMKSFVKAQAGQLDMKIDDGGKNLSIGQRQLLCQARGLLPREGTKPRILLCDEVTANIDLATDEKVHDVLLKLDATVMMICHRLHHIHRFDQVIVLAPGGRVQECGAPADLLAQPGSALNDLFQRAGLSTKPASR